MKTIIRWLRRWSLRHNADALHSRQRYLAKELGEAETALTHEIERRDKGRRLGYLVGLACLLALPLLVLLNTANDAPILEALMGMTGSDPWETPFGRLQPLALGASAIIVIAMGLAALLALGQEPETDSPEDFPAPTETAKSPFNSARRQVRWLLAVTVMLALVVVVGYGGYLRAKMQLDGDSALAAFASQQGWVSGVFAMAIALVEEAAVVTAVQGFILPQFPVNWTRLRLWWIRKRYLASQNIGLIHEAVTEAEEKTQDLVAARQSHREQGDLISDTLRQEIPVSASPNASPQEVCLTAIAERKTIGEEEATSLKDWAAGFEPQLAKVAKYPYRAEGNTGQCLAAFATQQAVVSSLETQLGTHRNRAVRRIEDARARTLTIGGLRYAQITKAHKQQRTLQRQWEELNRQRRAILSHLLTGLNTVNFRENYTQKSQNHTLTRLNELLTRLDGESDVPAVETADIGQRITHVLHDLERRLSAEFGGTEVDRKIAADLAAVGAHLADAIRALDHHTAPAVSRALVAVEETEEAMLLTLNDLDQRMRAVKRTMQSDHEELVECVRQENWLWRRWLARVSRFFRRLTGRMEKETAPISAVGSLWSAKTEHLS